MNTTEYADIKLTSISDSNLFKVSRSIYQNSLAQSLKTSGMLEIPFVIKKDSGYILFTCHNRIKILREAGVNGLRCCIIGEPDAALFMNHVSLKAYRNEIGPVGKLKSLKLLKFFFRQDETVRKEFCSRILKLPHEIIDNDDYLTKIFDFPEVLLDYLDEKDMSFKIIKDLSLLPEDWVSVIAGWLKSVQVRVNIFRMLADFIFDIYRRGDSVEAVRDLIFTDDKTLYDGVFRLRYPEFSKLKNRSESIVSELATAGLSIEFPEYFDRKSVTIKLEIDNKSDCNEQLKKIRNINADRLKELLSLLS